MADVNKTQSDPDSKVFIARTLRLMNYLVMNGNYCYKVEDDEHNPKFKVFLFDVTEKLNKCVAEYSKMCKAR